MNRSIVTFNALAPRYLLQRNSVVLTRYQFYANTFNQNNKPNEKGVIENVVEKAEEVKDWVGDNIKKASHNVAETIKNATVRDTNEKPISETVSEKAKNAKDYIVNGANQAAEAAKEKWNVTKETAEQVASAAQEKFSQTSDTVQETMKQATGGENIKDKAFQAVNAGKEAVKQATDYAKDKTNNSSEAIKQSVKEGKDTAKQAADYLKDKSNNSSEAVKQAAKAGQEYVSAGKEAVRQATEGTSKNFSYNPNTNNAGENAKAPPSYSKTEDKENSHQSKFTSPNRDNTQHDEDKGTLEKVKDYVIEKVEDLKHMVIPDKDAGDKTTRKQ